MRVVSSWVGASGKVMKCSGKNPSASLKTVPASRLGVQVHLSSAPEGGQAAKQWVLKSVGGDDPGLENVYRFIFCFFSARVSAVIH